MRCWSVSLQEDDKRKQEKADKIKREWERRMNPSSKTDFDLLYAALESKALAVHEVNKIITLQYSYLFHTYISTK